MARNATITLTGAEKSREENYAGIVKGFMDGSGSSVIFDYTSREGVKGKREAVPTEIVGTPGTSSHGFKGMTDKGPRTFNFYLMG